MKADLYNAQARTAGSGGIAHRTAAGFVVLTSADGAELIELINSKQSESDLIDQIVAYAQDNGPEAFAMLFTAGGDLYLIASGNATASISSPSTQLSMNPAAGQVLVHPLSAGLNETSANIKLRTSDDQKALVANVALQAGTIEAEWVEVAVGEATIEGSTAVPPSTPAALDDPPAQDVATDDASLAIDDPPAQDVATDDASPAIDDAPAQDPEADASPAIDDPSADDPHTDASPAIDDPPAQDPEADASPAIDDPPAQDVATDDASTDLAADDAQTPHGEELPTRTGTEAALGGVVAAGAGIAAAAVSESGPPAADDIMFAEDISAEPAPAASAPVAESPAPATPAAPPAAAPPAAAPPPPTPAPPAATPDPAAAVGGPVMVLGVACSQGHHNHPDAVYCSQCGTKMGVHHTTVLLNGPRPPLGVLVVDDGTTYSLNEDLVIGREPTSHEDVIGGTASPMILTDDTLSLSRKHARIVLDEWQVAVQDLGSSNGTYLSRAGSTEAWTRVPSGSTTALEPGDRLRVGGRIIQVELHHVR